MNIYTIKTAYPIICDNGEITIESDGLYYSEIFDSHTGCQCQNLENKDIIHDKCIQIASLIRDIDVLNNTGDDKPIVCPCCGSDKTYKTEAIHCKRCAVTTEL